MSLFVRTRRSALTASWFAVGIALAGCSAGASGSQGDEGGEGAASEITIALPDEPASLDPCDATYTENNRVLTDNVTEALVDRDPETGELVPRLAAEWSAIDDSSYEFRLREGVAFSDGTSLDAESVAEAINRAFEPDLNCGVKGFIFNDEDLSAEAVDETVVRVTATQPDPILPLRMSFIQIGAAAGEGKIDAPVGTGPYALETWDRGQQVLLARNPEYWGDEPEIDRVRYVWRPESSVRANMVTTGEADLTIGIAPQDAQNPLAETFPLAETVFLRIDTFAAPMDDIRIRQAMNHAIDREGLIESLLEGMAEPASQIIVENINGYDPDIEVWPYDVEEASRLVEEARADGVPVDQEITLYGRQGFYPNSEQAMEAVAEMLREVGLNARVEQLEVATWLDDVLRKPFPAERVALTENVHGNTTGDAIFTVATKFSSEGDESTLEDPRIDELIGAASVAEGEERTQTFQELMGYLHDEVVPTVPIAHLNGALMASERLSYTPNLQSNDILAVAEMNLS